MRNICRIDIYYHNRLVLMIFLIDPNLLIIAANDIVGVSLSIYLIISITVHSSSGTIL